PPGAKFIDNSRLFHGEFNYNFADQIDWIDILVGGNYRQYSLFSDGTIFNEDPVHGTNFQRITINEVGFFAQFTKTITETVRLTSGRRSSPASGIRTLRPNTSTTPQERIHSSVVRVLMLNGMASTKEVRTPSNRIATLSPRADSLRKTAILWEQTPTFSVWQTSTTWAPKASGHSKSGTKASSTTTCSSI